MYSTTDGGLPFGQPELEGHAHTGINHKPQRQLDIEVVIYAIQRPVRREMQNIVNDHYSF